MSPVRRRWFPGWLALALVAVSACARDGVPGAPAPTAEREVRHLLADQVAAWNAGDIGAFCAAYADDASFLGPGGLTRGRAAVEARYRRRYPDRRAMGHLELEPLEIRSPGAEGNSVVVVARWTLRTGEDDPSGVRSGYTMLVISRGAAGWQITHDVSFGSE